MISKNDMMYIVPRSLISDFSERKNKGTFFEITVNKEDTVIF